MSRFAGSVDTIRSSYSVVYVLKIIVVVVSFVRALLLEILMLIQRSLSRLLVEKCTDGDLQMRNFMKAISTI